MECESEKKDVRYLGEFELLCEKYPQIVQEMAYEGDILDPDVIEICRKHGVRFLEKPHRF